MLHLLRCRDSFGYDCYLPEAVSGTRGRALGDSVSRKVDRHIRVADAVLFYTIRNHEVDPRVKNAWVEKCKEIILSTDDTSLLESLIYTVEGDLEENPLYERALQVAAERPRIATALSNVGLPSPF